MSLRVVLDILAVALIVLGLLAVSFLLILVGSAMLAAAITWHLPNRRWSSV